MLKQSSNEGELRRLMTDSLGHQTNLSIENAFVHRGCLISKLYEIFSCEEIAEFKNTWNNLPYDKYLGDNEKYRKRCISKFLLCNGGASFVHVDDCSFYQSANVNKRLGGIKREYRKSEACFIYSNLLKRIIIETLSIINRAVGRKDWMVTCHQFRIFCSGDVVGLATPEGIHRDGHDFVAQHLIARRGVDGGDSHIYDNSENLLYTIRLENFLETLILDDRRVTHDVSVIKHQPGTVDTGYRDMLVIDYDEIGRLSRFNGLAAL